MTSAPADLLEVQRYTRDQTGQPWASLGIIHSTPQGGGYHEGEDLLIRSGTAPGPQYPGSDYSYADAPGRDLLPNGRLAGGDYASAFDLGGDFPGFLKFNAWMRGRMLAGDPRTADIREMIYTLDGRSVRRIDRTGIQGDGGDNSHLGHTHFSFYRDSVGRRNRADNFLGLLKEHFEGTPQEEEDDMTEEQMWDIITGVTYGSTRAGVIEEKAPVGVRPAAKFTIRALSNRIDALAASEATRDAAEATRSAATLAAVKALAVATGNDPEPIMKAIADEGQRTRDAMLAQQALQADATADALAQRLRE